MITTGITSILWIGYTLLKEKISYLCIYKYLKTS